MSRFPQLSPEHLRENKVPDIEPMVARILRDASPQLEYKDSNGSFIGPWQSLHYTPDLIKTCFEYAGAVLQQNVFTKREQELSVLAVSVVHNSPFVLYAHAEAAIRSGFTEKQVKDAAKGITPAGISDEEAKVYEMSLILADLRGPLEQRHWENIEPVLGKARIARLAHVVTVYVHVSMMANIGDGYIPPPKEGVFRLEK